MPKACIVGSESVRMIELGHPWIIADAYTKRWPAGEAGELVDLTDASGRFLATALLDPKERIVARVLSRERVQLDRNWLKKRLERAIALRNDHADLADSNAYRLVNAEGDGLPGLTVDRYGDFLMVQIYCNGWKRHLKLVTQALDELLSPVGIYEKGRPQKTRELEAESDSKKYGRLLTGRPAPDPLIVRENGLDFEVSLERGLNTGLFLDQRKNRRDLMNRVKGKRFLNLFSYTGAFSVAAAAAGASLVTSVDASPSYMEIARANFRANKLDAKRHEFLNGDCFAVLEEMGRQRKSYDIILMDPPSFSTTAKSRFTTRGGTSDLVAAAVKLLKAGGLLITSSNHQKVDVAEYLKELRRGALQAESSLQVISLGGQPEDFPYPVTFPEGRYLKYAICVKG
ncbi:class I SAM-dependent rRNA methyltransferase [Geomesophilobacter sediminis]|uniref:Class I SAM-dependent rRNA methyltransferase n=1 Tax=Geomesophilobacter sediminis TaxID=2798584 RepID=A0A8J7S7G3_9BACT|nr:class I SAM-dependent rRNA methyltransferase [Geomesophilobacter sediminis]MBJ6726922.1 class I SAM-dependent rRNA methyltransferase [Geomesophilobacter sediminis]